MRSYRIAAPGAGIEGLAVTDDPVPRPGRGQVLVRMRAASLNHRDLAVVTGRHARAPIRAGLVPLSDGAGEAR